MIKFNKVDPQAKNLLVAWKLDVASLDWPEVPSGVIQEQEDVPLC